MLKSNCKVVRERVQQYIMDHFDPDGYDEWKDAPKETFEQVAKIIVATCRQEKFNAREQNDYVMLYDWFCGLPSILNTPYLYNESAKVLLQGWLEETEEEASRFSESETENKINYLIARELLSVKTEMND